MPDPTDGFMFDGEKQLAHDQQQQHNQHFTLDH